MSKVLVLRSAGKSDWGSVNTISENLASAYRLNKFLQCRFLKYNEEHLYLSDFGLMLSEKGDDLVEKILRLRPDVLAFIDDFPHPATLLVALNQRLGASPRPCLHFHVFGDFMLKLPQWVELEPVLKRFKVKWICASDRHAKLLSKCMPQSQRGLRVVAYPTRESVFKFDRVAGQRWRKERGIPSLDHVVLYTGRLSLQKNIGTLIQALAKVIETASTPTHLFLAGELDGWGNHILKIQYPAGFYFYYIKDLLEKLPASTRKKIHLLGNLNSIELNAALNAADLFVSPSLHHDEDFGLAPAEALCAGTPSVLTDWGGYASHRTENGACTYLPVRLKQGYPSVRARDISNEVAKRLKRPARSVERRDWSRFYRERLGLKAVAERLRREITQRAQVFSGFDVFACKEVEVLLKSKFERDEKCKKIYEKFYSTYRGELK